MTTLICVLFVPAAVVLMLAVMALDLWVNRTGDDQ
jgi:hypothetical protein